MISRLWRRGKKKSKSSNNLTNCGNQNASQTDFNTDVIKINSPECILFSNRNKSEPDTITYSIQGNAEWPGWNNHQEFDDPLKSASMSLDEDGLTDEETDDVFGVLEPLPNNLGSTNTKIKNLESKLRKSETSKPLSRHTTVPYQQTQLQKKTLETTSGVHRHLNYWFLVSEDEPGLRAFFSSGDRRIEAICRASACDIRLVDTGSCSGGIMERGRKKIEVLAPNTQALHRCCAILDDKFPRFYASAGLADSSRRIVRRY